MIATEFTLISQLFGNQLHTFKPNFGCKSNKEKITFDNWWNQIVIRTIGGSKFSRKKIILAIANQDGGAHVDPSMEEDYYNLTRLNSAQHYYSDNIDGSNGLPEQIPFNQLKPVYPPFSVYYSIRQIAHEVLISKINPEMTEPKIETIYTFDERLYEGTTINSIQLY